MDQQDTSKKGRSFIFASTLDYGQAGYTSRTLTAYALRNSTLSSWKQFYHQPYKCDWAEATKKAIERKERDRAFDA